MSPSKGIEEGIEESKGWGWGDFAPDRDGVLLPRHFDNSLSVYLFLEFEP